MLSYIKHRYREYFKIFSSHFILKIKKEENEFKR